MSQLQLLRKDTEEGYVDFEVRGPCAFLYGVMDDAIAKYGDNFICGDLQVLKYYRTTRGPDAGASMLCRFLSADDAMLWKLSLLMD